MAIATACPTPEQLQSLIDGTLPDDVAERLTEHVGNCSSCQERMQSLATGTFRVEEIFAGFEDIAPPLDSAFWPKIKEVESNYHAPGSHAETAQSAAYRPQSEVSLDFLSPSDDPAYLGMLRHFAIARIIGQGGMGIVLEAFDTHLQRNVAIKVLNPKYAQDDIARQRFCREGRAAAAITHEHVVAMHQVVKEDEGKIAFLVMQLIDGETLEQRLSGNPLPLQDVIRIGMQAAAGLAAAHSKSMVHRDVKPANILIERETNRVKLTDFGLARARDDIKLTQTGMISGTPLYMSPEQAVGGTADERSDLFSLGAVLYEMATGQAPFQAASIVGVMRRIMDESPAPPHEARSSVSRPLSDLIMSLLEKDPNKRPASAALVAEKLAGMLTQFGAVSPLYLPAVTVKEGTCPKEQPRRFRPATAVAWSVAAVALLALGGLFGNWLTNRESASTGSEASISPVAVFADNPGTVWSVDFAPDGSEVGAAIEDGSVRIWDLETQQFRKSFNAHRGIVWTIRFHDTRPLFATSGDDGMVKLWNRDSYQLVKEWRANNAVRSVAFSPDGARIVAGDREGIIHVFDIDSGEELLSKNQSGSVFGVDYSPDGKFIATVGTDKIVRI